MLAMARQLSSELATIEPQNDAFGRTRPRSRDRSSWLANDGAWALLGQHLAAAVRRFVSQAPVDVGGGILLT
jgi:hypothetical protein